PWRWLRTTLPSPPILSPSRSQRQQLTSGHSPAGPARAKGTSMIRFRCPYCDQVLKVREERAGTQVVCPRCKERSLPTAAAAPRAGRSRDPEGAGRAAAGHGDQAPAVFSGMSCGLRRAVAVVAAVGVGSLMLAVVAPLLPGLARHADALTGWAQLL